MMLHVPYFFASLRHVNVIVVFMDLLPEPEFRKSHNILLIN